MLRTRDKIMPVNSKWKIEELFEALHYYKSKSKKRITFEYILIKGINDEFEQAKILAKRAKALGALVTKNRKDNKTGPWGFLKDDKNDKEVDDRLGYDTYGK